MLIFLRNSKHEEQTWVLLGDVRVHSLACSKTGRSHMCKQTHRYALFCVLQVSSGIYCTHLMTCTNGCESKQMVLYLDKLLLAATITKHHSLAACLCGRSQVISGSAHDRGTLDPVYWRDYSSLMSINDTEHFLLSYLPSLRGLTSMLSINQTLQASLFCKPRWYVFWGLNLFLFPFLLSLLPIHFQTAWKFTIRLKTEWNNIWLLRVHVPQSLPGHVISIMWLETHLLSPVSCFPILIYISDIRSNNHFNLTLNLNSHDN